MASETVSETSAAAAEPALTPRQALQGLQCDLEDVRCLLEAIEQIDARNSCNGRLAGMALLKVLEVSATVTALERGAA